MGKTPPRLSRIAVFRYLREWDGASLKRRYNIIEKFIEDYTAIDPIDTDNLFSRAGGLIFTRFTVGMQIAFARRKPVWHYFQALNIFVKSLQGERYIVEFTLMGALMSTFEVLRVDEMKDNDKSYVFQFLIRMIEGCGGTRVKEFICSDTSYLESVVDCLTMCKNRTVIHHARLFLANLCQGNTPANINMVSKYVISLLPCDFNPRVQALACRVLPIIIHQNHDIASHCYSLVVDALKTDYNEMLVEIGDTCLAMMDTTIADDLLTALMEAALPTSLSDNLEAGAASNQQINLPSGYATGNPSQISNAESSSAPAVKSYTTHDTYFRQQYGALFTISFMLKNKPGLVDQMMEHGILGSVLAAIGTASYSEIQLAAIRLLLLVHELSPDCVTATKIILPKNLLLAFLSEVEDALQYLTAPMCVSLRKIGRGVQGNWREWYDAVLLPFTTVHFTALDVKISSPTIQETSPIIKQIHTHCETLAELTSEGLFTMAESMPIIYLDEAYRDLLLTKTGALGFKSAVSLARFIRPGEVGESQIQADPALEGFRKYLVTGADGEGQDNFEKFGLGAFMLDDKDSQVREKLSKSFMFNIAEKIIDDELQEEETGGMTDLQTELLENAMKAMQSEGEDGEEYEEGDEGEWEEGGPAADDDAIVSTDFTSEDVVDSNDAKAAFGASGGGGGTNGDQGEGNN